MTTTHIHWHALLLDAEDLDDVAVPADEGAGRRGGRQRRGRAAAALPALGARQHNGEV